MFLQPFLSMSVQHPIAAQLLKRKFLSSSSFCSEKEQASPWQGRQDDKGFPGAPLKLIFMKHGLFHKEITRDQCDSRQTPCLQPFSLSPLCQSLKTRAGPISRSSVLTTEKVQPKDETQRNSLWKDKGRLHEAFKFMEGQSLLAQPW